MLLKTNNIETDTKKENLTILDWIYIEYINLTIFIDYHFKTKNSINNEEKDITIMRILTNIKMEYEIYDNLPTILKWFLYWIYPDNWSEKTIEIVKWELSMLLSQKSKYNSVVEKYTKYIEKFADEIRTKIEENLSFDEAFHLSKDKYIPNLKETLLNNDIIETDLIKNWEIYIVLVHKFKIVLKNMIL